MLETLLIFVWPLFVGLIVVISLRAKARARRREDASAAYRAAVKAYRQAPHRADLRRDALESGRACWHVLTNEPGSSRLSELALPTDLDEIGLLTETIPQAAARPSTESRLLELESLREKGLIDDAEHRQRRAEILAEI